MITVRYFAAAAEAAGTTSETFEATGTSQLRAMLVHRHGAGLERVLDRCSVLVEGRRAGVGEDLPIAAGAVVDVLPPFAGG